MKKIIPVLKTDEEAEHFVETADLSNYDLSRFKPVHFETTKDMGGRMVLPGRGRQASRLTDAVSPLVLVHGGRGSA